jgi:hypothetical protein
MQSTYFQIEKIVSPVIKHYQTDLKETAMYIREIQTKMWKFSNEHFELMELFEKASDFKDETGEPLDINDYIIEDFPYNLSFDEFMHNVATWRDSVSKNLENKVIELLNLHI